MKVISIFLSDYIYIYNFNSIVVDEITNSMIYYIIIFILKIYNN